MLDQDFPALYRSADELSLTSQRQFFLILGLHLVMLVIAAILSVIGSCWSVAIVQLLVLLCALGCSVLLFALRLDRRWYGGRAVAESIKTVTWRYASRAEPFQGDDECARHYFRQMLRQIVEQNREVCQYLATHLDEQQFTPVMDEMRAWVVRKRQENYAKLRINDQLTWYAKKAAFNRKMSRYFFRALVGVNVGAVIFAAFRVRYSEAHFWPTDVFIAMAASILSWMQAKRFSELASSYALAAHEISLIKEQSMVPYDDEKFSLFVGDAENAFSREHTQWVARKDV